MNISRISCHYCLYHTLISYFFLKLFCSIMFNNGKHITTENTLVNLTRKSIDQKQIISSLGFKSCQQTDVYGLDLLFIWQCSMHLPGISILLSRLHQKLVGNRVELFLSNPQGQNESSHI